MDEHDLLLGYGDSLMMSGRLVEALDVYSQCPGVCLDPQRLAALAASFLRTTASSCPPPPAPPPLACVSCQGVLVSPVTGPCGHTACRRCLGSACPRCARPTPPLRDNVLVKAVVDKWWPLRLEAARLRYRALDILRLNSLELALHHLNNGLQIFPRDHLLLETRSEVLCRLNRCEASLQDAEQVTKLKPHWSKGYYRKGIALSRLGQYEESLLAFSLCVSLDKNYIQTVKQEVTKILQRLLNPAMPCKMLFMRNPLTPWWSPNYIDDDTTMSDDILESYSGNEVPNYSILENRKLHLLMERISHEIENLRRLDASQDDLDLKSVSVELSDFECVLCCRTLWKPVTTPCGHTYCYMCLERSLDYSSNCPLCITPLTEYLSTGEKSVTDFIETSLLMGLPKEYTTRLMAHREEVSCLALAPDIPVFVCTTAFPTVSCPLFVFEPRYRLMVRRAVEAGARRFGMAACFKQDNGVKRYADYGTELEIQDWILLNDGCSILSNIGVRRFRVTSRGEKDGYDTARVEYFSDEKIPESSLPEITKLHDRVLASGQQWFNRMSAELRMEILRSFGDMPSLESNWTTLSDGPAWMWWLLAILPLGPHLQVGILATTCLEKRLRAIDKTLKHLEQVSTGVYGVRSSHHTVVKQGAQAIRLS